MLPVDSLKPDILAAAKQIKATEILQGKSPEWIMFPSFKERGVAYTQQFEDKGLGMQVTVTAYKQPVADPTQEMVPAWCREKIYNASIAPSGVDDHYLVFFRGVGEDRKSRIGLGLLNVKEGTFAMKINPLVEPQTEMDQSGVEDPRASNGLLSYTSFDGYTARCTIRQYTVNADLTVTLSEPSYPFLGWDKDIPPEQRDQWNRSVADRNVILPGFSGKYPHANLQPKELEWTKGLVASKLPDGNVVGLWGEGQVRQAAFDGENWHSGREVFIGARSGKFDAAYVETGSQIEKMHFPDGSEQLYALYNGVDRGDDNRSYYPGIVFFDQTPQGLAVTARSEKPFLVAQTPQERIGKPDVGDLGEDTWQTASDEAFSKSQTTVLFAMGMQPSGEGKFFSLVGAGDVRLLAYDITLEKLPQMDAPIEEKIRR